MTTALKAIGVIAIFMLLALAALKAADEARMKAWCDLEHGHYQTGGSCFFNMDIGVPKRAT